MAKTTASNSVSMDQMRWLRLRRSGLVEGLPTIADVAHRLCGVQAQVNTAAFLASANRLSSPFDPSAAEREVFDDRNVVRITAQRGTVHLHHPQDLAMICAAVGERERRRVEERTRKGLTQTAKNIEGPRRDGVSDLKALGRTCETLMARLLKAKTTQYVSRGDFDDLGLDQRLAYGTFAILTACGEAVRVERGDNTTPAIAARARWLPEVVWPKTLDSEAALSATARRFFNAYGPATERDLRHWLGAGATEIKPVVTALVEASELLEVDVDGVAHLIPADLTGELQRQPPAAREWPVKLLYRFDPLLLAYHDKSWLLASQYHPKVWHGTHVEPVILVGGQILGMWKYAKAAKGLKITYSLFEKPLTANVRRGVQKQAEAVAAFFNTDLLSLAETP